jgi:transcriptional regulator with XRE-family HTH domain
MLRHRREQLGLSMRETARRVGISPSYLVAIEQGRNPSTGRAPIASPPILAAIGQVLGIELATLLDVSGVPTSRSAHLLLFQTGSAHLSPLDAARRVFAGRVNVWIEIIDPRASTERATPDDVLVRTRGPLGLARSGLRVYEPNRVLGAVAEVLAQAAGLNGEHRLGLIFGANSNLLRAIENPVALLESETTWEHDVAAACQAALGVEPVANVCVYRESDIQELAAHVDPLTTVLSLVQTHPHVAVQDRHGAVAIGPAAIETILTAVRPAGINSNTWASLASAAAVGLTRNAATAQPLARTTNT